MSSRTFKGVAAPFALSLAALLLVARPAAAGAPANCQQPPLTAVVASGGSITIEECTSIAATDAAANSPALVAVPTLTYYNVYNQSTTALAAFAVSNTVSGAEASTTRPDWQALYVSKATWNQLNSPFLAFGSFENLFGNVDSAASFYSATTNTSLIAGNTNSFAQFFVNTAPNSNFIALAANGAGGLQLVAQSLTPVPEVPAFWLMGAGLAGLAGLRGLRQRGRPRMG